MRKLNLLAAAVVVFGAGSLAPKSASAIPLPRVVIAEELWGYCCTSQGVKCCSRGGCTVSSGGCVRL